MSDDATTRDNLGENPTGLLGAANSDLRLVNTKTVECPSCDFKVTLFPGVIGRSVRCPKCDEVISVQENKKMAKIEKLIRVLEEVGTLDPQDGDQEFIDALTDVLNQHSNDGDVGIADVIFSDDGKSVTIQFDSDVEFDQEVADVLADIFGASPDNVDFADDYVTVREIDSVEYEDESLDDTVDERMKVAFRDGKKTMVNVPTKKKKMSAGEKRNRSIAAKKAWAKGRSSRMKKLTKSIKARGD